MAEKIYTLYEGLENGYKTQFDEVLELNSKIADKEAELNALKDMKKTLSEKIIQYLQEKKVDGVKKDRILAFLQLAGGGAPSYNQVIKEIGTQLCDKDRALLADTYQALKDGREKSTRLVIKEEKEG